MDTVFLFRLGAQACEGGASHDPALADLCTFLILSVLASEGQKFILSHTDRHTKAVPNVFCAYV